MTQTCCARRVTPNRGEIDYIIRAAPFGFISSDGGRGKNDSGIGALAPVKEAGIAGAAVSAQTARMGDGLSTYLDGIIGAANELAVAAGVRIGMTASEAAHLLLRDDRRLMSPSTDHPAGAHTGLRR